MRTSRTIRFPVLDRRATMRDDSGLTKLSGSTIHYSLFTVRDSKVA
jgi:hypothetical protein